MAVVDHWTDDDVFAVQLLLSQAAQLIGRKPKGRLAAEWVKAANAFMHGAPRATTQATIVIDKRDADTLLEVVERQSEMVRDSLDLFTTPGDEALESSLTRLHRAIRSAIQAQVHTH